MYTIRQRKCRGRVVGVSTRTAVGEGSDASTPGETRSGRRPFAIYYPEYGIVAAIVGYALFYTVVDFATPMLVESLAAGFPAFVAGPMQTWAAVALWAILGLTIPGRLQQQTPANPHVFETREELVRFLRDERPTGWNYRFNVTLALVGGIAVWALWPAFRNALEELLLAMPELDAVTALAAETFGTIAVFAIAFAALTRGIDRVLIGQVREAAYRDAR
jgi:hypothetical protein